MRGAGGVPLALRKANWVKRNSCSCRSFGKRRYLLRGLIEQPSTGAARTVPIVPAAMREDDTRRIPKDHLLDRRPQLQPGKSKPHVARHLSIRVRHARKPGSQRMKTESSLLGSKFSIRSVRISVRLALWKNSTSVMKRPYIGNVAISESQG